jgi:hypothetical protein
MKYMPKSSHPYEYVYIIYIIKYIYNYTYLHDDACIYPQVIGLFNRGNLKMFRTSSTAQGGGGRL